MYRNRNWSYCMLLSSFNKETKPVIRSVFGCDLNHLKGTGRDGCFPSVSNFFIWSAVYQTSYMSVCLSMLISYFFFSMFNISSKSGSPVRTWRAEVGADLLALIEERVSVSAQVSFLGATTHRVTTGLPLHRASSHASLIYYLYDLCSETPDSPALCSESFCNLYFIVYVADVG